MYLFENEHKNSSIVVCSVPFRRKTINERNTRNHLLQISENVSECECIGVKEKNVCTRRKDQSKI